METEFNDGVRIHSPVLTASCSPLTHTAESKTFRWRLNMGQHGWKGWMFELSCKELRIWSALRCQLLLQYGTSHHMQERKNHFPCTSPALSYYIRDLFTLWAPLLINTVERFNQPLNYPGRPGLRCFITPLPTHRLQLTEQISWIIEGSVLMYSARCSGKGLHRFPYILISDAFQLLAEGSGGCTQCSNLLLPTSRTIT